MPVVENSTAIAFCGRLRSRHLILRIGREAAIRATFVGRFILFISWEQRRHACAMQAEAFKRA
jgi:hypothetical protein